MGEEAEIESQKSLSNSPENMGKEKPGHDFPAATIKGGGGIVYPHQSLPKPEAPPGLLDGSVEKPSQEKSFSVDVPAIGNYLRERRNSLSAAISRRLSLNDVVKPSLGGGGITEFSLSGVRVVVRAKEEGKDSFALEKEGSGFNELAQLKGRVTFFSRSNCRDSGAVRSLVREKGLKYAEINIDVFPSREKELIDRTGGSVVPQIFFNEQLIGGLVALNSLRNSGLLDRTAKELLVRKCPDDAPQPPVYGFDEPEEEQTDDMAAIVKVLRQRLPIQDRLIRMRIVKNCFTGLDLVDVLLIHMGCSRHEAVEIGKRIAKKHFIHHVSGASHFEDGNEIYRFLEHEQFILKCFNFRGCTDDKEPDSVARIGQRLMKIMSAILESYASEDRCHVDYLAISNSEEFRRYLNVVQCLHRVDLLTLSPDEKLAFFLNLYNAMVIHAVIRKGYPEGMMERKSFVTDFQYLVGGNSYSLNAIRNGILRSNRRAPYALVKHFTAGDSRLQMSLPTVNPVVHFGLCDGTKSSPPMRFFTSQNVQAELRAAARDFFKRDGVDVDLSKRTVYLTCIVKWYKADFGNDREILRSIMGYLDADKAGLVNHLLGDGEVVHIVHKNYNWSINS